MAPRTYWPCKGKTLLSLQKLSIVCKPINMCNHYVNRSINTFQCILPKKAAKGSLPPKNSLNTSSGSRKWNGWKPVNPPPMLKSLYPPPPLPPPPPVRPSLPYLSYISRFSSVNYTEWLNCKLCTGMHGSIVLLKEVGWLKSFLLISLRRIKKYIYYLFLWRKLQVNCFE